MKSLKEKSKKKQEILNKIPIFLAQTYRIVDNPTYSQTIAWMPDGHSFIIKNVADLTTKIFPEHFKHSNFASFVRQLNMYGFHKVRSNDESQVFQHQYFQKDTPDLLSFIKRKKGVHSESQKIEQSNEIVSVNSMVPVLSNRQKQLQTELNVLSQKHESLEKLVSILVQQNKEIIIQNKNFINKIAKADETYRRKLQALIFFMMLGRKNSDGNIIIPQQTHTLLKGLSNKNKKKNSSSSNAIELFNKDNQSANFSPSQVHELYKKLVSESEGQNSENEEKYQNSSLGLNPLPSIEKEVEDEELLSPKISLRSIPSNCYKDDYNDFKFEESQLFDFGKHQ